MKTLIKDNKKRFIVIWILLSSILLPVSAILGFLIILQIHGKFGYDMSQVGSPLAQTVEYCIWVLLIGAFIGIKQWLLLQKQTRMSSLFILACIGGLVISECLAGIILWKLGINRADLGWAQGGSIVAETLIFLFSGALIGLFQYPLLRRNYNKAGLWVLACTIGWGFVPIVIVVFGGLVLGLITGATLIWILQPKVIKP